MIVDCDARRPINEPVTAPANDNTQPLQIKSHNGVIQKLGSTTAEIIPIILQMTGTYQKLDGLFLHIKKQATAIKIS